MDWVEQFIEECSPTLLMDRLLKRVPHKSPRLIHRCALCSRLENLLQIILHLSWLQRKPLYSGSASFESQPGYRLSWHGLPVSFPVVPAKSWDSTWSLTTAASFHILSNSLFTHRPAIRHCVLRFELRITSVYILGHEYIHFSYIFSGFHESYTQPT